MSSLGYSRGFFVISHILSIMFEIKVFNHTFQGVWCNIWCQFSSSHCRIKISWLQTRDRDKNDEGMPFGWSKWKFRYRSNKLIVEGGKCNLIIQVAKVVLICKRLRMWMKITNNLKWYDNLKWQRLPYIFSIFNGHMPLGGEWVVSGLTHTYWWFNMFICH